MKRLFKKLLNQNKTISACESFTGGFFSNEITNIKGSSDFFKGSFICYTNKFKNDILKIDIEIIKKYGIASEEVVEIMLKSTFDLLNTQLVFAFSGYATPLDKLNSKSGTSYLGYRLKNQNFIYKFEVSKNISRLKYKKMAIKFLMKKLFKNNFLFS